MNYDTLSIKAVTEAANLTSQQNIDADIILPDYYDTIGKILKSEILPVTEAVTANGDKISVAGIAKFSMLYVGEDNKMYCYENEYKYTKVFQTQFAENCLSSLVKQTVFSLNCRAIAPKRIELRAVLQIGVKVRSESDKTLICSIDDDTVISKSENIGIISTVNSVSRNFSLTASYPLTDFNDKLDIIIRKDSRIRISEIKTIHNKAYVKGLAETEILYYSNETSGASSRVLSLPVSEIIDIFGAEEDDICNVFINDIYTEIIIKDIDSDNKTLDIRLDINIQAELSRNITESVISDVYSVKNEICSVKDTAELITASKKLSKTENITFETDIYDESTYSVIDCWITNMRISAERRGSRYNLLITALFNAFIKNEYGSLSIISREHTFEAELICESAESTVTNLTSSVLSISALQTKGGKIRFSADIIFEADAYTYRKVSGFTSIQINDNVKCDILPKFTVYFAKQNEEIWEIAKENKTSVEAVKTINNLSGDLITEDKMLLLPSF